MASCSAYTRGGEPCKASAMKGSEHCYNHEPSKAIERKESAIKAGRSGGRGRPRAKSKELSEVKQGVRSVVAEVYEGRLDKGTAAVLFQGFNVMLRAVEMEHAARESEEKERRWEELEQRYAGPSDAAREPSPADVAAALSQRVTGEAIARGESEEVANERGFQAGMAYLDSLPDGAYREEVARVG